MAAVSKDGGCRLVGAVDTAGSLGPLRRHHGGHLPGAAAGHRAAVRSGLGVIAATTVLVTMSPRSRCCPRSSLWPATASRSPTFADWWRPVSSRSLSSGSAPRSRPCWSRRRSPWWCWSRASSFRSCESCPGANRNRWRDLSVPVEPLQCSTTRGPWPSAPPFSSWCWPPAAVAPARLLRREPDGYRDHHPTGLRPARRRLRTRIQRAVARDRSASRTGQVRPGSRRSWP